MALQYASGNSTINGASTEQMNSFLWLRKAIIESRKDQYFFPLADVKNMPKHHGKTIKVYEYIPLLDDRNVNDQGIDANGVRTAFPLHHGSVKQLYVIMPLLSP